MGWTAAGAAIGIGSSLVGSLFGKQERAQDKEMRNMQLDATKTGIAGSKTTAAEQMSQYGQFSGMGTEAMGMSSPIYQNLLKEYTKQVQNPYDGVAPQMEQAARDAQAQQGQIMSQYGRGPGQQYAAAMAQSQIPIYGQQQMQAQRNAGMAGMGNIAGAYENRANTMFQLAGQNLGNAGSTYSNLAQSGRNWQPYQSPIGSAIAGIGGMVGQGMMGLGGEKTNTSGYGNFIAPTGASASVPTTSSLFPRQYLYGQTPNAAKPWGR